MMTPVTRRSSEDSLGKKPTTRVRRLICELSGSHMLEVRRRWRPAWGKLKAVSPSGMFCSAQVGDLGQRAVAPFFRLPIQFGGELGGLGGGDAEAANFTHDGGDAAGADALKIHARDGGFEGAVAAAAFLQKGGPERDVTAPDLGCGEVESAHRGVEAAGFDAVGVAVARLDAFIRAGTDVLGAFHEHGGVHEQFGDFGESFAEAVLKKEVYEIMVGGSGWLVFVHGCCFLVRTSSN